MPAIRTGCRARRERRIGAQRMSCTSTPTSIVAQARLAVRIGSPSRWASARQHRSARERPGGRAETRRSLGITNRQRLERETGAGEHRANGAEGEALLTAALHCLGPVHGRGSRVGDRCSTSPAPSSSKTSASIADASRTTAVGAPPRASLRDRAAPPRPPASPLLAVQRSTHRQRSRRLPGVRAYRAAWPPPRAARGARAGRPPRRCSGHLPRRGSTGVAAERG